MPPRQLSHHDEPSASHHHCRGVSLSRADQGDICISIITGGGGYYPTCGALLNEEEVAIGGSDSKTYIYSIVNDSLVEATTISTRFPGDEISTTLSCMLMKCLKPSHLCW